MTFEQLMTLTTEDAFVLSSGSVGKRDYVFENGQGTKIHFKSLSTSVDETLPMWTVDVDGDRVQFDNPTQLLTVNTIVTGLIARSVKLLQEEMKKNG